MWRLYLFFPFLLPERPFPQDKMRATLVILAALLSTATATNLRSGDISPKNSTTTLVDELALDPNTTQNALSRFALDPGTGAPQTVPADLQERIVGSATESTGEF